MGVYIKGMEMPENCLECVFYRRTDPVYDYCCISSATPKGYVPNDCPLVEVPSEDVVEIPETGIGDFSDGYHTFNGLYYQRMVLFNALVNAYNGRAWKSWKHEDGEPCFGGGWFIVGIDTPKGSYTYHYEDKYWNWFECEELPVAKHWDGHTEEDVTRLLTLPDVAEVVRCKDCKNNYVTTYNHGKRDDPRCDFTDRHLSLDDFCSRGERRMDGE